MKNLKLFLIFIFCFLLFATKISASNKPLEDGVYTISSAINKEYVFDINQGIVSNGSNIFICNLNGQNCSTIISNNGMVSIDNIYVTDNYIYYMISSYTRKNYNNSTTYYIVPSGNRVMRCNLNGQSCTTLLNNNGSISSNLFVK